MNFVDVLVAMRNNWRNLARRPDWSRDASIHLCVHQNILLWHDNTVVHLFDSKVGQQLNEEDIVATDWQVFTP